VSILILTPGDGLRCVQCKKEGAPETLLCMEMKYMFLEGTLVISKGREW